MSTTSSPTSTRPWTGRHGISQMALLALDRPHRRTPRESAALTIALVNNMPDAALKTTERQWCERLASAAGDARVELRWFSFPELPRSPDGRRYVAEHH